MGTQPGQISSLVLPAPLLSSPPPCTLSLQPYHIDFERVAYGSIFHQCVYLLARKDDATMQVSDEHRK